MIELVGFSRKLQKKPRLENGVEGKESVESAVSVVRFESDHAYW